MIYGSGSGRSEQVVSDEHGVPIGDERSLVFIPSWIEDETLYSWCSRWHIITLNRTRTTGEALFGISSSAKVRYVPNPFGWFDRVAMGRLGSPSSILKNRTETGSYLSLARHFDRKRVELGGLPPAYLFSAKSGVGMSLRYCKKCESEQLASHEVAIWRINHQLPGVAVCADHGQPLVEYLENRQIWKLPYSRSTREILMTSQKQLEITMLVARAARIIFESGEIDTKALRDNARKVLCEAYGALDAKRLDPEKVERDWRCSVLYQWCTLAMFNAKAFPRLWLTDLIRGRRSERNPLRWAYAVAYFSERSWTSIAGFFASTSPSQSTQLSLWADLDSIPFEIQRAFECANTLTQAAAALGVTTQTVRRWMHANQNLYSISRHWKFRR